MGKLTSGILGPVSGKVAGVVGGRWKDKQYLRGYAIPANPNTAGQQVQRGKLADCVAFCKPLVGPIFNTYSDKFIPSMSGFNAFIKANIALFDGSPAYASIKFTEGKLWMGDIDTCLDNGATVDCIFATTLGNNGLATDKIYAAVCHTTDNLWRFAAAEVLRSAGTIAVPVEAAWDAADMQFWLFSAKYVSGVLTMISNSKYAQVTE